MNICVRLFFTPLLFNQDWVSMLAGQAGFSTCRSPTQLRLLKVDFFSTFKHLKQCYKLHPQGLCVEKSEMGLLIIFRSWPTQPEHDSSTVFVYLNVCAYKLAISNFVTFIRTDTFFADAFGWFILNRKRHMLWVLRDYVFLLNWWIILWSNLLWTISLFQPLEPDFWVLNISRCNV